MKEKIALLAAVVTAALAVTLFPVLAATPAPEATVTATKGPIQLTLHLYKKTVKAQKSLWYQIELKNVSKNKILIEDRVFKDPWAMKKNCWTRYGIYLDIASSDRRYSTVIFPSRKREHDGFYSPPLRQGGGEVRWDFEGPPGQPIRLSEKENEELVAFKATLAKQGLTDQQRSIAIEDWKKRFYDRKVSEEQADPAKQFWLPPGASTRTFAWAYADMHPGAQYLAGGEKAEHVERADEEKQIDDYAQLWSYSLVFPGKYRIRAVYEHGVGEFGEKLNRKHGITADPWRVTAQTPFIEFEVVP